MERISKVERTKDFQIDYIDTRIDSGRLLEHFHDSYEIDFFIKADIQMFCRDRNYHISDGDMFFINEFDLHKINYTPETAYIRYVINFKKGFLEEVLKSLELSDILENFAKYKSSHLRLSLKRKSEIESAFQSLYNQSAIINNPYTTAKIKLQLVQLIINLAEYMKKASSEKETNTSEAIVKKLINYIDTNYMKKVSLDLLEQEFFISKYYLSHIFKEITGFTIVEYIQSRRIIEAQKKLINTTKQPEVISSECGFNSLQHFYKTFKEIAKVTPKKYRDFNKRSSLS